MILHKKWYKPLLSFTLCFKYTSQKQTNSTHKLTDRVIVFMLRNFHYVPVQFESQRSLGLRNSSLDKPALPLLIAFERTQNSCVLMDFFCNTCMLKTGVWLVLVHALDRCLLNIGSMLKLKMTFSVG